MKKPPTASTAWTRNGTRLNGEKDAELKQLLVALTEFKRGDFSAQLPDDWTGIAGKVADTFNDVIRLNQRLTQELARIGHVVGKEGRIRQRASLGGASGSCADAM